MPLSPLSLSPSPSGLKKSTTSTVVCLALLLLFPSLLFFAQRSLPLSLSLLPQSFSAKIQPQSAEIDDNRPSQPPESPSNIDPAVEEAGNGASREIDDLSPIPNLSPTEEGVLRRGNGKDGCNLYEGRWVKDEEGRYPLYAPGSCPYVDDAFTCQENGRDDRDYMKWRWKPNDCELPRLSFFGVSSLS